MSLGTFRLSFTGFAMMLTLVASSILQLDLFKTIATLGFIAAMISLADIVFIKIYIAQNKDSITDLFKDIKGDDDGTSGKTE